MDEYEDGENREATYSTKCEDFIVSDSSVLDTQCLSHALKEIQYTHTRIGTYYV